MLKIYFDISSKVIIITGATGNLGSQYVEGLSQVGAHVVIADVNLKKCTELADSIKTRYDVDPLPLHLDFTNDSSLLNMVNKVYEKYSRIDVLVNNAAYQGDVKLRKTKFENFPLDAWNKAIDINLTGVFRACQEVGDIMCKQGYGNIINIASTYGIVAPDQRIYGDSGENSAAFYAATKSAVINLTRYLASYWRGKGIRVNTLSPGGVFRDQESGFIENYEIKQFWGEWQIRKNTLGA